MQHFDVPPHIDPEQWCLNIDGEVHNATTLTYDELRRLPNRTVWTVMECSGSDADFFEYFKGQRERPSRAKEGMILSAIVPTVVTVV